MYVERTEWEGGERVTELSAIAGKFHPFKAISIPDAQRNESKTTAAERKQGDRRPNASESFVAKIQRYKVSTMRLASILVKTLNFMKRRGDSVEICKYAIKRKPSSSAVATTFAAVRANTHPLNLLHSRVASALSRGETRNPGPRLVSPISPQIPRQRQSRRFYGSLGLFVLALRVPRNKSSQYIPEFNRKWRICIHTHYTIV